MKPPPPSFDAILMASGLSRRFGGQNKLLVPFRGLPLARHTLNLVCAMPEISRVIFVCSDPLVAELATGTRAELIVNTKPQLGQRQSVRLGALASAAEYMLFFPCDQPLLDVDTVRAVLSAARPGAIVSPVWGGKPGNPTLFSSQYRAALATLQAGQHPRMLKTLYPNAAIPVSASSAYSLADADPPKGLEELESSTQTS